MLWVPCAEQAIVGNEGRPIGALREGLQQGRQYFPTRPILPGGEGERKAKLLLRANTFKGLQGRKAHQPIENFLQPVFLQQVFTKNCREPLRRKERG